MAMMEITRNGVTTFENWIHEIESTLTDDEQNEFALWDNGSLSIDAITDEGPGGDHVHLDIAAVRQLRDFMNSPKIAALLNG